MKISIQKALSEYTKDELRQFHANLTAIFTCTEHEEPLSVFSLLLEVTAQLSKRKDKVYLDAMDKMLS